MTNAYARVAFALPGRARRVDDAEIKAETLERRKGASTHSLTKLSRPLCLSGVSILQCQPSERERAPFSLLSCGQWVLEQLGARTALHCIDLAPFVHVRMYVCMRATAQVK